MQELDFDAWYDLLLDAMKALGERRKPDRISAHEDFAEGKTPEQSARLFYAYWNPEDADVDDLGYDLQRSLNAGFLFR